MGIEWQGEGAKKGMFFNVITEKRIKTVEWLFGKEKIAVYFFDKCQNFVLHLIDGGWYWNRIKE